MILTTEIMATFLGVPMSEVLADEPFRNWRYSISVEKDLKKPRVDYTFEEKWIDFICDLDGRVRTIFVYYDERWHFNEGLSDLSFCLNRAAVRKRFGVPHKSGGLVADPVMGETGPWDRFSKDQYSIHFEYDSQSDQIRMVTLMRADAVP